MDISPLRNEITIGSNGVYRLFKDWGFNTTYFTMEDVPQRDGNTCAKGVDAGADVAPMAMTKRLKSMLGTEVALLDLYASLPLGPYPKRSAATNKGCRPLCERR